VLRDARQPSLAHDTRLLGAAGLDATDRAIPARLRYLRSMSRKRIHIVLAGTLIGCSSPSSSPPLDVSVNPVLANSALRDQAPLRQARSLVANRPSTLPSIDEWSTDFGEAKRRAAGQGRPMIVEFFASWVPASSELEKETFANPAFRDAAARFIPVRIDCSNEKDYDVARASHDIKGLPVVLLIDSKGVEKERLTQFIEPDALIAKLRTID
jgi:thiol:disulfide interchange protein